ncbi:T3SC_IA_ShcM-like domain containing protein [Oxalobacteraceae bacterium]
MNHSQFIELCRDISTELNLEDLDELGFSNYLEIDDIPMAFIFDEH